MEQTVHNESGRPVGGLEMLPTQFSAQFNQDETCLISLIGLISFIYGLKYRLIMIYIVLDFELPAIILTL